ncbi:MAG: hypothetical protein AAGG75_24820 [Bacteroidota bacterium]
MMQKQISSLGLALLLLLAAACSDVIVPDIEGRVVNLIAPADSLNTTLQTHNFVWDEEEDASSYRLQIVKPDFENIEEFILDSTTTATSYEVTLQEGSYQWRVLAVNEAYTSDRDSATIWRLFVRSDASVDLSNQIITIIEPGNNIFTQDSTITFSWNGLSGADKYILQIGDVGLSSFLFIEELSGDSTSTSFTFDEDGDYQWQVRAESDLSQTFTDWASRELTIDRQPPAAPTLEFPTSGSTIVAANQSPDLFWIADANSLIDTLYVYRDGLRDSLLFKTVASLEYNLEDSGIDFVNSQFAEDYFWQVRSVDRAGNVSDSSSLRLVFVQ